MKVLIGDDNKNFTEPLSKFLALQDDIEVVGVAINGRETVEKTLEYKPDVVLLDVVMPELDGLGVIEHLVESKIEKMPKVILLSAITQGNVINEALELGAYCFILKPCEFPALLDRIRTAHAVSCGTSNKFVIPSRSVEDTENLNSNRELDVEVEVTNLIHKVGIPANINGHQYLREAILRVIEDRGLITGVTKELYPDIAKKYKTTGAKVERSIRHAIEVCWLRGRIDVLESTFGYSINPERGKPTNSEFIAMVADKIRMDIRTSCRV